LEARGGWKYLHNEEICNIHIPTPNIIRMNKLMRLPEEVTHGREEKGKKNW
jgi:hypothetical protein